MFDIRLSPSFSVDDYQYDIELPQVPAVGDTIAIGLSGRHEQVYQVLARRFIVDFGQNMDQIADGQPRVLLHVEKL